MYERSGDRGRRYRAAQRRTRSHRCDDDDGRCQCGDRPTRSPRNDGGLGIRSRSRSQEFHPDGAQFEPGAARDARSRLLSQRRRSHEEAAACLHDVSCGDRRFPRRSQRHGPNRRASNSGARNDLCCRASAACRTPRPSEDVPSDDAWRSAEDRAGYRVVDVPCTLRDAANDVQRNLARFARRLRSGARCDADRGLESVRCRCTRADVRRCPAETVRRCRVRARGCVYRIDRTAAALEALRPGDGQQPRRSARRGLRERLFSTRRQSARAGTGRQSAERFARRHSDTELDERADEDLRREKARLVRKEDRLPGSLP